MDKGEKDKIKDFHVRARMPQYFRYAAATLLGVTLIAVGIAFYRSGGNADFRMKGFPTSLSQDVVAVVNGYERREMDGDVVKYYIRAEKGTTFADNHQELENVFLEVFNTQGGSDKITAQKAVYVPEENKNFTGYFAGNVSIETRDALKVVTDQVTYKKADEIATAEEAVEFERGTVRGRSFGGVLRIAEKKIELLRDVEISTYGSPEEVASDVKQASIRAHYAIYDQPAETVDFRGAVETHITSDRGTSDARAERANVVFEVRPEGRNVKTLELHENVWINANRAGEGPVEIRSGSAVYDRTSDKFDLRGGVRIDTTANQKTTTITSASTVYEQTGRRVFIDGNAEITHGSEFLKGDHIYAELHPGNKLKLSNIRGNAYLRQVTPERTTELSSAVMDATFNEQQHLQKANATNGPRAVLTPANTTEYSKVTMTAPRAMRVDFRGEGLLEKMSTDGRTVIDMQVANNAPDSANRRVTADTVNAYFNPDGKDLKRTEAVGNAELFVEPMTASPQNYRTRINAPRFDCEFFPTGNNARECIAPGKPRTVRLPTVAVADRGEQTLTSEKMIATFDPTTKDVQTLEAVGSAKFTELDRHAWASQLTFTQADEVVRLRGEPVAWDSRARAKAGEIDWDTKNQRSYLRGGANTTYYSQKATGGAAPFASTNKPVFMTAQTAEFDHKTETGFYSGNARAWQESNYVRGDKLWIWQREGRFAAEGNVQSLLYNVRKLEAGKSSATPIHVASRKMSYERNARVIRYENDVDIRQGTDRIVAAMANIFLDENNEMSRGDVEGNVVITQPKRRAVGDFAQYTVADESVILRGNPARVEDAESGASTGGQMTVYLRDNRVFGDGRSKQNSTGRIRSVYKVKTEQ